MKKIIFTGILFTMMAATAMAQKKDSISNAKSLVEQGSKADRHLGKELQKASLIKPPVRLQADTTRKKENTSKAVQQQKPKKKSNK
ncbi:MAG: hypothetical protein ACO1OO_16385 [Flavisolibacter sp.]